MAIDGRSSSIPWREGGVLVLLLITLALGVLLRAQLAGVGSLGVFAHLRHAHSHLGYYGVLLPALWGVWSTTREGRSLSAPTLVLYGVASLAAALGFASSGYGPLAIVSSTIVGALWLLSAWKNRALASPSTLLTKDWLAAGPVALLIACLFVPFIALSTRRDPVLAQSLVRIFLGVLLFGAVIPAALSRLRAPAPRALPYLVAAVLAAVSAGAELHPLLGIGLVVVGALIARAVGGVRHIPLDLRGAWLLFALGTIALGLGVVPRGHATAVSALHFVILAPLLCTFAWQRWPTIPRGLRAAHLLASALMVLAIYLGNHRTGGLPLASLSALSGSAILVIDVMVVAWLMLSPRGTPAALARPQLDDAVAARTELRPGEGR